MTTQVRFFDSMAEDWTDKLRLFVKYYTGECNLNGAKAARKAGYPARSARQVASENLSKPYVRAEVDRILDEQAMSRSEVLARLSQHGRGDMRDFIGLTEKQLKRHPDGALIKKYKRTVTSFGKDADQVTEERIELELYDAQAALVHLGKHHRLFIERVEFDWVRELEAAGINPNDVEQGLVEEFERHLLAGAAGTDRERVAEGAGAGDGTEAEQP